MRPNIGVSQKKVVHEQKDKKCLRNTNILNYLASFDNSSIVVITYKSFMKLSIGWAVSR